MFFDHFVYEVLLYKFNLKFIEKIGKHRGSENVKMWFQIREDYNKHLIDRSSNSDLNLFINPFESSWN